MVCECRGQITKYENKSPRSKETVSPVLHPKERAAQPYEVWDTGTQRERGTKGPIWYCLSTFFFPNSACVMMTYVVDVLAHSEHRTVCPQRPRLLISWLLALLSGAAALGC